MSSCEIGDIWIRWVDCINVIFLVVRLYYRSGECQHWGKLDEGYIGYICIISYSCVWIYNYLKKKKCLWWHSFAVEQRLNLLVWTSRPFHVLAPLSPAFCLLFYERCIFTVWTCVTRNRSRSRTLPGPWKPPSSSHPFTTLQRVIAIWFLFHVLVLPIFELHINEFMDFFFKLASFPQHSDYLCCR